MEFSIKRFLAGLAIGGAGLYGLLFGVGFLTNIHNLYLRTLSHWTVLIHNSRGSGATGFVVRGKSGKKYIMTNGHVCSLQEDGKVFVYYKGDEYRLKVVKFYAKNDLCAIEAPGAAGLAVNIASNFREGESAYAIGHPLLEPKSITLGELSGPVSVTVEVGENKKPEECTGETYELIDLSTNPMAAIFGISNICVRHLEAEAATMTILPGNSGSAVVNIYGSVIGVAFAANESGTRSYIVPLSHLKEFLGSL
jgi:S1-C subfamily serine protease